MTDERKATGRTGEALAAAHLQAAGWRIHATNWRCALGEIDIVAHDGETLVIVEVRTRHGDRFGSAAESVGWSKQRKLARLAEVYVQSSGWPGAWRIDVVAITLDHGDRVLQVEHFENAVHDVG